MNYRQKIQASLNKKAGPGDYDFSPTDYPTTYAPDEASELVQIMQMIEDLKRMNDGRNNLKYKNAIQALQYLMQDFNPMRDEAPQLDDYDSDDLDYTDENDDDRQRYEQEKDDTDY